MRWFRHADRRYPFLWESTDQPPARWHGPGEGPAQYLADTPIGAWAEFARHEAIAVADELRDVNRALWAIEVPDLEFADAAVPSLPTSILTGGLDTYDACRAEASRIRSAGATGLHAMSAALQPGGAGPQHTSGGLRHGPQPTAGSSCCSVSAHRWTDGAS
ncbi:MAG: RES domain-containing protein [Acidimicrobiales bacterium]